jgi:cyanobactin maturation PatA/PatG family protease
MDFRSALTGLQSLQGETLGEPEICVAVIDGPVDLTHPCFEDADLHRIETLVQDPAGSGRMSAHGTHVASLIFGQPNSPVPGVAPRCTGLIVPVFRDYQEGHLPQLDLARAIEQAVQYGAHVISVSGGERSPNGQADAMLERALRLCKESNVLVVAAAGNDGCECLHVPAAIPSALAVGALGDNGEPLGINNWGEAYRANGVLAPGEKIVGAAPGGDTASRTGSSFATPLVAGVAALLLSVQRRSEGRVDPRGVADAILRTATACHPPAAPECRRYLAGVLNIPGAHAYIRRGGKTTVADLDTAQTSAQAVGLATGPADLSASGAQEGVDLAASAGVPAAVVATAAEPSVAKTNNAGVSAAAAPAGAGHSAAGETCGCGGVKTSENCSCQGAAATPAATATAAATVVAAVTPSYAYALGTIGFDFGTEARRDTFRQSMPDAIQRAPDGTEIQVAPNPYDVFQLTDYLDSRPSESTKIIWTLNLDLTPIYALEAEVAYPEEVYEKLRTALRLEALPQDNPQFVSRVSIPGVMANRSVRLFSGQVIPVVVVQPRGLFSWNEPSLVNSVVDTVTADRADTDEAPALSPEHMRQLVRIFLDKVYFECRNLGLSPPDRALNFAATNAFQFGTGILRGFLSGRLVPGGENSIYTLDSIDVSKSPYCRVGSDCYDVLIKWFDPENERRAKSVFQFTIDVSDELPVTLAPAHQYFMT